MDLKFTYEEAYCGEYNEEENVSSLDIVDVTSYDKASYKRELTIDNLEATSVVLRDEEISELYLFLKRHFDRNQK